MSESDSVRVGVEVACGGSRTGAGRGVRKTWSFDGCEQPTSETQRTVAPLNSCPSSFSTAAARSAAVSYSTKLMHVSLALTFCDMRKLTLCRCRLHRAHGQLRSRRRRGPADEQNPSGPRLAKVSPDPRDEKQVEQKCPNQRNMVLNQGRKEKATKTRTR